jgi:hypothetical protein
LQIHQLLVLSIERYLGLPQLKLLMHFEVLAELLLLLLQQMQQTLQMCLQH